VVVDFRAAILLKAASASACLPASLSAIAASKAAPAYRSLF